MTQFNSESPYLLRGLFPEGEDVHARAPIVDIPSVEDAIESSGIDDGEGGTEAVRRRINPAPDFRLAHVVGVEAELPGDEVQTDTGQSPKSLDSHDRLIPGVLQAMRKIGHGHKKDKRR